MTVLDSFGLVDFEHVRVATGVKERLFGIGGKAQLVYEGP